ncbi:MAG TPA: hypothetical protein VK195_14285 [Burkholderiaceae bacterium]|nr:hypothetical protein [Burkholderiaceae bacterium]
MNRRHWMSLSLGSCLSFSGCVATYPSSADIARINAWRASIGRPPLSEEDIARLRRFRELRGGQKYVDGFGYKEAVEILDDEGQVFFVRASVSPENRSNYSYSSNFGVPRTLHVTWRKNNPEVDGVIQNPIHTVTDKQGFMRAEGGIIIGDYTVPVADRIPDELLRDLPKYRKNGLGFRLKIRLHDEGVLIGWDIANLIDRVHVGGDFEEAHVVYDWSKPEPQRRSWAKGWYIHPRTRERLETDF